MATKLPEKAELILNCVVSGKVRVALFAMTLLSVPCLSETLRVTTWNMQDIQGGDPAQSLEATAGAILKADPDILLLQHVRDWKMCLQLTDALKPSVYYVLVCSAFSDAQSRTNLNEQAAILSKRKAYFAGSEQWQAPSNTPVSGGFVFSAIQTARHRVGLFSVTLEEQGARSGRKTDPQGAQAEVAWAQQWSQEIESLRNWTTNRMEAALIAGAFSLVQGKQTSEQFAQRFLAAPISAARIPPEVSHFAVHLAANSDTLPGVALARSQVTCDVDLDADVGMVASADLSAANSPALQAKQQLTGAVDARNSFLPTTALGAWIFWLTLLAATILLFSIGFWLLSRRMVASVNRLPIQVPLSLGNANSSSPIGTVVITSGSITRSSGDPAADAELQTWQQRALLAEQRAERTDAVLKAGILPHLRQWLKERLFRKLIADRAALLETQQVATLKARAVDERLSRIEQQLQKQNRTYERRIEQLTKELIAAKEESRALIRAQIAAVKAEMEAARTKLLAEADL